MTDIYLLDHKPIQDSKIVYEDKKKYFKKFTENFLDKLLYAKDIIGESVMFESCRIIFIKVNTRPSFTGKTDKNLSLILCFPSSPNSRIMKSFEKLLFKQYIEAMIRETDFWQIQTLETYRNIYTYNWSPYKLSHGTYIPGQKIGESYTNLNENGISYNDFDIQNPSPINYSWTYLQTRDCIGYEFNEDVQDLVPPLVRKTQMHYECCWVYDVNWDSRWTQDVTCSASPIPICQPEIKIIRATIYRRCLLDNIKHALQILKKPNLAASNYFNYKF